METLSNWFENLAFGSGDTAARMGTPVTITVIGSGGKTSLVWLLARELAQSPAAGGRRQKVLVTPTAKMLLPEKNCYDFFYTKSPPANPGITLAGIFNPRSGKLESLPPPELEQAIAGFDALIAEGDGSRGLPLKGWAEHEPVVPPFTTITVGMLPVWPLGQIVNEQIIHRLPQFCALSGAKAGEPLAPAHLAAAISRGLFCRAQGKKILFFNQIESPAALSRAREVLSLLPAGFRAGLEQLIAGSVQDNSLVQVLGTDAGE